MRKYLLLLLLLLYAVSAKASGTCTAGAISAGTASTGTTISGCWYVSNSIGSDTLYDGTTETISGAHGPFANPPGGHSCASNCASASVIGGNGVIFRGGDTWPLATFQISTVSGTSGHPTYYGVDQSWFSGGSWVRPIFNPGSALITNNDDNMMYQGQYSAIDNIEFVNFYWDSTTCTGTPVPCGIIDMSQTNGQFLTNNYIHAWTHGTSAGLVNLIVQGTGGTSVASNNVIVGNAADYSAQAFYGGPPTLSYNFIKTVISCFVVGSTSSVHDNHCEDVGVAYCNPGCGAHMNGFEDNGFTGTLNFYNNEMFNISGGLGWWFAPNPGAILNAWNNVLYAVHGNNVINLAAPVYSAGACTGGTQTTNHYCSLAGTYNLYNNTVQCGDDTTQYDQCQTGIGNTNATLTTATAVLFKNNHIIDNGGTPSCYTGTGAPVSCSIDATNISQTQTVANGQGYTSAQTYPFSPTLITNSTVGNGTPPGTNETSLCVGVLVSLCSDTTLGVGNTSNTVVSPVRATNPRPSTGGWNSGAFQFNNSTVATPTFSPGTGTYSSTQTVTISTSTGGATLAYTTDGSTPTLNTSCSVTHGTLYSAPVSVSTSQTLSAVGCLSGDTNSATGTAVYVINAGTAPAPAPMFTFMLPAQTITVPIPTAPLMDGNVAVPNLTTPARNVSVTIPAQTCKCSGPTVAKITCSCT